MENRNGVTRNGITKFVFMKSRLKSYLTFVQNCTILSVEEYREESSRRARKDRKENYCSEGGSRKGPEGTSAKIAKEIIALLFGC